MIIKSLNDPRLSPKLIPWYCFLHRRKIPTHHPLLPPQRGQTKVCIRGWYKHIKAYFFVILLTNLLENLVTQIYIISA